MTGRDLKILRAVRTGRATVVCGCLKVDGCWCADQDAARVLVDSGLVAAAIPATDDSPVLAVLTDAGMRALGVAA